MLPMFSKVKKRCTICLCKTKTNINENQALSSHLVGKYNEYNLYLAEKCTSDIIVYLSMYVLQQHDDTMLCFAIVFGKETTTKKL